VVPRAENRTFRRHGGVRHGVVADARSDRIVGMWLRIKRIQGTEQFALKGPITDGWLCSFFFFFFPTLPFSIPTNLASPSVDEPRVWKGRITTYKAHAARVPFQ
jgi:hypothetical protein